MQGRRVWRLSTSRLQLYIAAGLALTALSGLVLYLPAQRFAPRSQVATAGKGQLADQRRSERAETAERADCRDVGAKCDRWVNGCAWDGIMQQRCAETCKAGCGTELEAHGNQFEAAVTLIKSNALQAIRSPELDDVHLQVARVNRARLQHAALHPTTCQPHPSQPPGAVLSHKYPTAHGSALRLPGVAPEAPQNIQAACQFHMTDVREPPGCPNRPGSGAAGRACSQAGGGCAEPPPQPGCPSSCVACRVCADSNPRCREWAVQGQCEKNPDYMATACRDSCGLCGVEASAVAPAFVALWSGLLLPTVGFGTAGLGADTYAAVRSSLAAGAPMLDSAEAREWYREDLVAKALADSGVPRERVLLVTKVHPRDLGFEATLAAVHASLETFQTPFMDLVLLHYAECWGNLCPQGPPAGTWRDSWRALEQLWREARVLSMGVSNFSLKQLQELVRFAQVPPMVVQRRSDAYSQDIAVQRLCRALGIQYMAYSSLGTQYGMQGHKVNPVLGSAVMRNIAEAHGVSVAQVALAYGLRQGQVVIPRSKTPAHIAEAMKIHHINFTNAQLLKIRELDGTASVAQARRS